MAERLHFNTGMAYESMLAAEHLARYWLLKDACQGKRVLDVACGEGYGSSLLRKWGASLVVGVDISTDAIANANEHFGGHGVSYREGDACNLDSVLSAQEQFDLIVSYETMEHVPDVSGLLRGMRDHLAPNGTIAISCPNDPEVMGDERNEYHLKTYTFAEFQDATSDVLGEAAQWLLGTPVLGFGVCDATDRWAQGASVRLSSMLQGSDAVLSRFLPAQAGHEINAEKAHFYVGVWGAPLPRSLVAAPIAHRAYVGPWNSWVAAKQENERLRAEQAQEADRHAASIALQASKFDVERQQLNLNVDELRHQLSACMSEAGAESEERQRELQQIKSEIGAYKVQIASERSARLLMASKLYERDARHRHLTESLNRSEQRAAALESSQRASDEARRALESVVDQSRAVQADLDAERNALSKRLQVVSASRGYRATQRYYRLYEHGATRWFMRPVRRWAAVVLRALR